MSLNEIETSWEDGTLETASVCEEESEQQANNQNTVYVKERGGASETQRR